MIIKVHSSTDRIHNHNIYYICLVIRLPKLLQICKSCEIYFFLKNPINLGASYKTDLIYTFGLFLKGKTPSYNRKNTV